MIENKTAIEVQSCQFIPARGLRVMLTDGSTHEHVRPAYAAPLSHPGRFVSLIATDGHEIAMIPDLSVLPVESHKAIEQELCVRELTSRIDTIENIREEFEIAYWLVSTQRGPREFVTREMHECVRELSPGEKYLITDVEGNRFEIEDFKKLDAKSQALFKNVTS